MWSRLKQTTEFSAQPKTLSDLEEFIRQARNNWFDDTSNLYMIDMNTIHVVRGEDSESIQDQLPFEQVEFERQPSDYDWPKIDRRRRERTMDDAWEDWRDGIAYR